MPNYAETLGRYSNLIRLAVQSVAAGLACVLVLHYFFPFAEHPRILSTLGLLLDIVGVTWIAYDIFPFAGLEEYGEDALHKSGIETPEYKAFKRDHVLIGLHILVIGFFFQILSYWVENLTRILP